MLGRHQASLSGLSTFVTLEKRGKVYNTTGLTPNQTGPARVFLRAGIHHPSYRQSQFENPQFRNLPQTHVRSIANLARTIPSLPYSCVESTVS